MWKGMLMQQVQLLLRMHEHLQSRTRSCCYLPLGDTMLRNRRRGEENDYYSKRRKFHGAETSSHNTIAESWNRTERSFPFASRRCSFSDRHGGVDGGEAEFLGMGTMTSLGEEEEELNRAITPWVRTVVSGVDLLRNPKYNKGMAFDHNERERMHLRGLLPPGRWEQSVQVERVLAVINGMASDPLAQYTFLMGLQERNEKLFFRVVIENLEQMMPIIYSPTVSKACDRYGLLFRRPRGLFISAKDSGRVLPILKNWPEKRVKVIAVSDGQNVLGLGDMGIQGMGNLVGKLSLYTACGGIHPSDTLPVTIDVGTDNEELLKDKFYLGLRHKRISGDEYDSLMDEFMEAVRKRFGPRVCIQFENISESNEQNVVNRYRGNYCIFNDDTQGIAAAALAGMMSSCD